MNSAQDENEETTEEPNEEPVAKKICIGRFISEWKAIHQRFVTLESPQVETKLML